MRVSVMVTVIPLGGGNSLSKYVAACERTLSEADLDPKLHAHGSNIEGIVTTAPGQLSILAGR